MTTVMPVRALVGAALTTALGLAVVLPATAVTLQSSTRAVSAASTAPTVLKAGSKGTSVTAVQRILAIKATGVFDRSTVAAVKRLQAWKRISPVNGVVSGATWTALKDPTLTRTMRLSRTARAGLAYLAWAGSAHGFGIVYRESHGSCTVVAASGSWRGKWQMTLSLWKANGGLKYAATPERASCAKQDKVAHTVWVRSGWGPWGG